MDFKGKVALITGSSSGIGEGIALKLATLGANVVITGRNETNIAEVVTKCQTLSKQKTLAVKADLLNDEDVKNLVEKTIEEFGKIDILVNNAGVAAAPPFGSDGYIESYDRIMNTNVRSVQVLTLLVVPYLEKTKGNIVNISSVAGLKPNPATINYCMAKSALDMFTQSLALALAPKGIRVNSVNPAFTRSSIFASDKALELIEDFCRENYPLKRIGETKDVAEMVAYLASEKASFMTGTLIPVDGGSLKAGALKIPTGQIKIFDK